MRLNKVEFLSFGDDRVYAKEQALIDLLTDELGAGRPCVVYLRQTATKDIQPRIESLIRQHVPGAVPYILKNTVQAERREKVIDAQIASGSNIIICNPELTKTGLDLIFAPTIIFFEITFNLSTMMQAAARSYRLNQTHEHCKVIYMFYEGTMEHTAVQLMSRKQRAAKLLAGDIGLTGLDAITEGEAGFEELLLDAIAKDEVLLDPSEMFQAGAAQSEVDAEDAAYWNVEVSEVTETVHPDPVIQTGIELGGVLVDEPPHKRIDPAAALARYVGRYLETVHLIHDDGKRLKLQAKLCHTLTNGVQADDETYKVIGMNDPLFAQHEAHEETLVRHVRGWLKHHRFVFAGCEDEVAAKVVDLAKQALGMKPTQFDIFEKLQDMQDEAAQQTTFKPQPKSKRRKPDLLAVPDDEPTPIHHPFIPSKPEEQPCTPQQLAMF